MNSKAGLTPLENYDARSFPSGFPPDGTLAVSKYRRRAIVAARYSTCWEEIVVVVKVIVVVVIGEGVSGDQRSTAPRLTISASATRKKESGYVSCVCVSKKEK